MEFLRKGGKDRLQGKKGSKMEKKKKRVRRCKKSEDALIEGKGKAASQNGGADRKIAVQRRGQDVEGGRFDSKVGRRLQRA